MVRMSESEKKELFQRSDLFDQEKIRKLKSRRIVDAINSIDIERLGLLLANDYNEGNMTLAILGNHNSVYAINLFNMEKLKLLLECPRIRRNIMKGLLWNRLIVDAINFFDNERFAMLVNSEIFRYNTSATDFNSDIVLDVEMLLIGNEDYVKAMNSIHVGKLNILFYQHYWFEGCLILKLLKQPDIINAINSLENERFESLIYKFQCERLVRLLENENAVYAFNLFEREKFMLVLRYSDKFDNEILEELLQSKDSVNALNKVDVKKVEQLHFCHEWNDYIDDIGGDCYSHEYYNIHDIRLFGNIKVVNAINSIDLEKIRIVCDGLDNRLKLKIFQNQNLVNAINSMKSERLKVLFKRPNIDQELLLELLSNESAIYAINRLDDEKFKLLLSIRRDYALVRLLENMDCMNAFIEIDIKRLSRLFSGWYDPKRFLGNPQAVNALKRIDIKRLLKANRALMTKILLDKNVDAVISMEDERFYLMFECVSMRYIIEGLLGKSVIDGILAMDLERLKLLLGRKISYFTSVTETMQDAHLPFITEVGNLVKLIENCRVVDGINSMDIQRLDLLTSKLNGNALTRVLENPDTINSICSIDIDKLNLILNSNLLLNFVKKGFFENHTAIRGFNSIHVDTLQMIMNKINHADDAISTFESSCVD